MQSLRNIQKERRQGRLYLFLFFFFVGYHKIDELQYYYTGFSLKDITILSPLFIPPIFLILAYFKYKKIHVKVKTTSPFKMFNYTFYVYVIFIFFLTIYGFLIGNSPFYVFTEIWIYLIVIFSMCIGCYDVVWEDIYKPLIILYWIFFVVVYFGTFIPRLHLIDSGALEHLMATEGGLEGTGTLAYDLYPIIDFFPIIFILSVVRQKFDLWKVLGLCTILGYLGLHIFFQKRAPAARGLMYIIIVFMTLQLIRPSIKSLFKVAIPSILGLILLFSIVSVDGLVKRLSKSGEDKSRQTEVSIMLSQLNPIEWVIGRGFGGYFVLGRANSKFTLGAYEVKKGVKGKVNLHIGFFYPILKGGLIFLFLTSSFFIPLIYRWKDKRWMNNGYNFTAFNVLVVIFLFQFIEGPFSSGVTFLGVLFGLCWSRVATSLNQFTLRNSVSPNPIQ